MGDQPCKNLSGPGGYGHTRLTLTEYRRFSDLYRADIERAARLFSVVDEAQKKAENTMYNYKETYGGTLFADGTAAYRLETYTLGLTRYDVPAKTVLTVKADAENRPTEYALDLRPAELYWPDHYDPPVQTTTLRLSYDAPVSVSGYSGLRQEAERVRLLCADNAELPADFITEYAPGEKVALPAPEGTSARFVGWYYDEALRYPVGEELEISYGEENMTIYPKWTLSPPDLVMDYGRFTAEDQERVDKHTFLLSDYLELRPVKQGWRFMGWYKDAAFTQPLTANDSYFVRPDTKLYAKFAECAAIELRSNLPDLVLNRVEGLPGEPLGLPGEETLVKRGGVFAGWYLDAALTQPAGEVFPAEDATFYAKYDEGYTVTVDMGEEFYYDKMFKYTAVPKTGTVEELIARLNGKMNEYFERGSLVFTGWSTNAAGTIPLSAYPTGDITVYPVYKPPLYVTVDFGEGTCAEEGRLDVYRAAFEGKTFAEAMEGLAGSLTPPEDQFFEGWVTGPDRQTPLDVSVWPSEAVTVYAKYSDIPRLYFDAGEGLLTGDAVSGRTIESWAAVYASPAAMLADLNLLPPWVEPFCNVVSPAGKFFAGWFTDEALTEAYTPGECWPAVSLTLYAKFETARTLTLLTAPDSAVTGSATLSILDYFNYLTRAPGATVADFLSDYDNGWFTYVSFDTLLSHRFVGFFTDEACTSPYIPGDAFETRTLYLKWVVAS